MLNSALFIRPHDFSTVLIIFACISTCCAFMVCIELEQIDIPSKVKSIGNGAFWQCHKIRYMILPDSVTSLGERSFYACSNMEDILFSKKITSIPKECFAYCIKFSLFDIPNGISVIHYTAFDNCKSLSVVRLPKSVISIFVSLFRGCPIKELHFNLSDLKCLKVDVIDKSTIKDCDLYIPEKFVKDAAERKYYNFFKSIRAEIV